MSLHVYQNHHPNLLQPFTFDAAPLPITLIDLQVARIGLPPPGPLAVPTPVAALAFDITQELLWTGNDYVSFSNKPVPPKIRPLRSRRA